MCHRQCGTLTAIGSFNGSLASTSAIDLGATVIKAAIERAKIDSLHIDEVIMGNVFGASRVGAKSGTSGTVKKRAGRNGVRIHGQ
ncbi:hypothetical protein ACLB1M_17885 [Escherichia coli]